MVALIEYTPMAPQENTGMEWRYMINPDKSPTPQFEQLCLGIANHISRLSDSPTLDLTPEKLAAFYEQVGGNYHDTFLSTPPASLSFIYQRLGCFHSLQPTCDAFEPPSIPTLLPHGFVRWQTIQLLLRPDEHARYLQEAVKKFNIVNPVTGQVFPKEIPRSVFPPEPDSEIVRWHGNICKMLEHDFWASKTGVYREQPDSPGPSPHQLPKGSPGPSGHSVAHDYFSKKHTYKPSHPDPPLRTAPRGSPPPVPHSREKVEQNVRKRHHCGKEPATIIRESRSSQSFRNGRPAPLKEDKRGRSCSPSGLRWSQEMSDSDDSSDSSESEDSENSEELPSLRQRESRRERLHPPDSPGQRRHSHDAGTSRRPQWVKPAHERQTHAIREEKHSHRHQPAVPHARQYRYKYVYPDDDEDDTEELSPSIPSSSTFVSPRRYSQQERYPDEIPREYEHLSRTTSAPVRKPLYHNASSNPPPPPPPAPNPILARPKAKDFYLIQPHHARSEPTSPGPSRRHSHSKTPPGGHAYVRYYVPRVESEPYMPPPAPVPPRPRQNSRSGQGQGVRSRSRGAMDRPFTLSYQQPSSGSSKRYR